jgi:hypothetical protein
MTLEEISVHAEIVTLVTENREEIYFVKRLSKEPAIDLDLKCGYVGSSSRKDGQRRLYIECTKEFFEALLAQKSYEYSETEHRAFKFLETTAENSELLALRLLTDEAVTSGKAARYGRRARLPRHLQPQRQPKARKRERRKTNYTAYTAYPARPLYKGPRRWKPVLG